MLGIIQGIALGYLAVVVIGGFEHFSSAQYWLAAINLLVFMLIWYSVTMDTTLWNWVPGLPDAIIPFIIGMFEVAITFAIYSVPANGLKYWLIVNAVGSLLSVIGFIHTMSQAGAVPEYKPLRHALRRHILVRDLCNFAGSGLFIATAVAGQFISLDNIASLNSLPAIGILALITAIILGYFIVDAWYWHAAVQYARDAT
jgi:hypothetical protein